MLPTLIGPSILSANFGKLNEEIHTVDSADFLHVDVMDGHFVPNLTIGAPVVRHLKSSLPLECHLMIEKPWRYIKDFAEAGSARIIIHVEACPRKTPSEKGVGHDLDLTQTLALIKSLHSEAGVAINPDTPLYTIEDVLDQVDMVLVMTVNPGFGNQAFIAEALPKIKELRSMKPNLPIGVDGGIKPETARLCREAGANMLIAGSYIFGASDRKSAIESLRD